MLNARAAKQQSLNAICEADTHSKERALEKAVRCKSAPAGENRLYIARQRWVHEAMLGNRMSTKINGVAIPQVATIPTTPHSVTSRAIINACNVWLRKRGYG
jgi:hypothetical protein